MAWDRQRGFFSWSTVRPCLLGLAVTALIRAASTTAQPQPQQQAPVPLLPNLPAACPPPQATLLPCITYFTGNSSSPPTACCSQVQAMFESQAPCLCAAMASAAPSQLGSALGAAQALLLPTACNLPPNACSGSTSPSAGSTSTSTTTPPASGATAAAATTPETTDADPTTAGGGLKSVPGLLDSAAPSSDYRGVSAAAVLVSLFVAYVV